MRKTIATLIGLVVSFSVLMMQVGPDDAATNLCRWLRFWPECTAQLSGWIEPWVWLVPAALFVVAVFLFAWPIVRSVFQSRGGALAPQPDMPIADALNYIVNDSAAILKQPSPPRMVEFGPGTGHLQTEMGVEHQDARTKLNEHLISGGLKIWGLRQMPVTYLANQFELSRREIAPTYWDRMQLDFLSCFIHTKTSPQTTIIPGKQADLLWTDLTLNREQLRRIWPRKPIWRRCKDKITHRERVTYYKLPSPITQPSVAPGFVSLKEGAERLYGEIRNTAVAKWAEEKGKSDEGILDAMGHLLAHRVPLQVRKAPSPNWEDFDKQLLSKMRVCGGATGIRYLGRWMPPFFTNVRLREDDLAQATISIIKDAGAWVPPQGDDDDDLISSLEIIFDPANPGRKFWSIEPMKDETGKQIRGSFWEYRAVIKNNSKKTARNVKVVVEAIGPMPTRPETALFDLNKKPVIDIAPHDDALAVIRRWFNPVRVVGMAIGADIYGPIKVTASADDTRPAVKTFHFDPEKTPMIWE